MSSAFRLSTRDKTRIVNGFLERRCSTCLNWKLNSEFHLNGTEKLFRAKQKEEKQIRVKQLWNSACADCKNARARNRRKVET